MMLKFIKLTALEEDRLSPVVTWPPPAVALFDEDESLLPVEPPLALPVEVRLESFLL
jgi:hypothetical protein